MKIGNLVGSLTCIYDIYLVGHNENMKTALQALEEDLNVLSLRINFAKFWPHKPIMGLSQDILVNPNLVVMKVPLSCEKPIEQLGNKAVKSTDAIATVDNAQNSTPPPAAAAASNKTTAPSPTP